MHNTKWRRFSCGVITDIDEDKCPRHGTLTESRFLLLKSRHKNCSFQEIDLSDEDLLTEIEEGNVFTKDHKKLENLLKEICKNKKEAHFKNK